MVLNNPILIRKSQIHLIMYLVLFHGRENPDQDMDDWGFNGPIIGNVHITWTYGSIKINRLSGGDHFVLPIQDDMVEIGGKYYGDFELIESNDFKKHWQDYFNRVISYDTANELITKQQANKISCQPQQQ